MARYLVPALRDMRGTSFKGYVPSDIPMQTPPIPPMVSSTPGINPYIRCPLPPLNAQSDTLRQFDESGGIPTRRVIPLPVSSGGVSNTTVTNTTVINQTGGGGSSSGGSLVTKTVTVTTPLLASGAFAALTVTMAKSFQLISMVANNPCEIRLYGSAMGQAADIARPTDFPLAAEGQHDLTTDVVMDTAPYGWTWQNRVGVNTLSATLAYVTIFNTAMIPATIQITITFLPLEV